MKVTRPAAAAVLAASALLLSACGSDNNATGAGAEAAASSTASCEGKDNLSAEGSSAQQNAMANFTSVYGAACQGKNVAYNPTGSGAGRTQFIAGLVDFAGSDSAIKDQQATDAAARCQGNEAWNLPLVFGPVALAYNLEGVDDLVLDADVTAGIFNGAITIWDDPAIAALNSGKTLPSTAISPIFRSDSSGTTDNFQKYLGTAAPEAWTQGDGSDFKGGVGQGAERSSGVAQSVGSTAGAITYVEKSFADQGGLQVAQIDNGSGPVELTTANAAKTIAAATFSEEGSNNLVLDLDSVYGSTEAGAYPLVLATYEIVCSKGYDADTSAAVKSFLTSALAEGQAGLEEAGYVPLPDSFKAKLTTAIDAIA